MLVGYIGPSKGTDYVRLYVDLTFRNYYEIPAEGIVSTAPKDASDENSPTTVHVAGDTRLEKVSVTSQSVEARFLQGSISSGYLGTAGAGAASEAWTFGTCQPAGAQVGAPSIVYTCWCNITRVGCAQQVAQPYTDTFFHTCGCSMGSYTCNNCGQAGAQLWPVTGFRNMTHWQGCVQNQRRAGAADVGCSWPPSPTCWCVHTQQGCS